MRAVRDRSPRSLAFGAARGVVLALACAWGLWLLAAQVFLWTPLLRHLINAHTPKVHLEYRSAWSWWPGSVHARGLVLTGQDRAVQWRLALDEVTSSIAIGQLQSRLFHATAVHVRGVEFALRRRLRPVEMTLGRLRGLPVIAGLEELPLREEGPNDELPDWRYRLFTVWLEDIAASEVRQIWIDQWRVDGAAELAGAFYLKPLREVLVAPGEARLHGVAVSGAGAPVAGRVEGKLLVTLSKFDPRQLTMERFFHAANADADLRGRIAGIDVLGGIGGAGPAHLSARMRKGRIETGDASFDAGPLAVRGVRAAGATVRFASGDRMRATLSVQRARLQQRILRARTVETTVAGAPIDFAALRPPGWFAFDVRGGRVDDARRLGGRLFGNERVRAGRGSFSAHLAGPLHRLAGHARVALSQLQISARGLQIRGESRADLRIAGLDPWRGADLAGTRVSVDAGRLVPDEEIGPGWWGRAVLTTARLRFHPLRVDAAVEAQCRDARPIVGVYAHLKDLPGFLNSLFGMDGLSVRASAQGGRGWFLLPLLAAEGNGASIRATLRQDVRGQRGAALLTAHGIPVALDLDGGGSSLHLFGPGDFFADRERELRAEPVVRPAPRLARRATPLARRPLPRPR
ncbi:MAG: hypothetical protein E6J58_22960 [Deltaproteobacteria bacterium]|nr:MAG: hypothetical protein E6J58_22960 [Deltaproteobacteria bacterium]